MVQDVFVVSTGTANLASVKAAFERIATSEGIDSHVRLVHSAREIEVAETLVLPGVGAFAAAMKTLQEKRFVDALQARIAQGRKTLCVCLGMQLLAKSSEESPGVEGLGNIDAVIRRFAGNVRVPHIGWNRVEVEADSAFLRHGVAYFANSYCLPFDRSALDQSSLGDSSSRQSKWKIATCDYDSPFVAALEYDQVLACQFHPELSGAWGQSLLRKWWLGPSNASIQDRVQNSLIDGGGPS